MPQVKKPLSNEVKKIAKLEKENLALKNDLKVLEAQNAQYFEQLSEKKKVGENDCEVALKGKKYTVDFHELLLALNNMLKGQTNQYRSAPFVHGFLGRVLGITQEEARQIMLNWKY